MLLDLWIGWKFTDHIDKAANCLLILDFVLVIDFKRSYLQKRKTVTELKVFCIREKKCYKYGYY